MNKRQLKKIKDKFYKEDGIKEEFDIYGYVDLTSQEWLVDTIEKLIKVVEEEIYGTN